MNTWDFNFNGLICCDLYFCVHLFHLLQSSSPKSRQFITNHVLLNLCLLSFLLPPISSLRSSAQIAVIRLSIRFSYQKKSSPSCVVHGNYFPKIVFRATSERFCAPPRTRGVAIFLLGLITSPFVLVSGSSFNTEENRVCYKEKLPCFNVIVIFTCKA